MQKKKKELEEVENVKKVEAEVEVQEHKDDRSVDDLVSFINGGHGDNKGVRTSKKKKKIRNRRDGQKNAPSGCGSSNEASHSKDVLENHDKDSNASEASYHSVQSTGDLSSPLHDTLNLLNLQDDSFNFEDEFDDDIDPVWKEMIDREVEDFARIINLSLLDRKQEIYSSLESRLATVSIEGNGSRTEDGN